MAALREKPDPTVAPWDGRLEFSIECRLAPNATSGARHPVVIDQDWAVSTPHDLAVERIASAFGGYTSCIEFADVTVPRLRSELWRVARVARPTVTRGSSGIWRVPPADAASCCSSRTFRSLRSITTHLRGAAHLATRFQLPRWQVDTVVRAVNRQCLPELGAAASASARLVREANGLRSLWEVGIHPAQVIEFARLASPVDGPLPLSYFEGVAYAGHDSRWITRVLRHRPDPDTAAWLAWQRPPTGPHDEDWGQWLARGLSQRDFDLVLDLDLSVSAMEGVEQSTGWSSGLANRVVIDFARAGARPTREQLQAVARHGREHAVPGAAMVSAAASDCATLGATIDRTELAVMLAIAGSRRELSWAIRHGCRSIHELVEADGERRHHPFQEAR